MNSSVRQQADVTDPIWIPSDERIAQANMSAFLRYALGDEADFHALYEWSVVHPELFWPKVWSFFEVIADERDGRRWEKVVQGLGRMAPPHPELGPRWFIGSRLNFAENLLRYRDDNEAIVAWSETGPQGSLTYARLAREVAMVADALRRSGIGAGDRVAAFMPNIPETIIAMLATASIGAVWSSCSPDFGAQGVLDRFGQIEPRILFCTDRYRYAGKEIDLRERIAQIVEHIPAIEHVVVVPYEGAESDPSSITRSSKWSEFVRGTDATRLEFARVAFDHPLYILYSSGTTGLPKCMVHSGGGTLLQHLKEHGLHTDIKREDRVFYFTTCGWMMWNWLVSSLALGATIVLYDGAPFWPKNESLWEMCEALRISVFGTSAKYLAMCEKHGLAPRESHDLSALRTILSTGSPLANHSFDYVYSHVKEDVHLASISGGTDIVSCFAGGNPIAPVYRGELQTRALGMAVHVFDENGKPVVEQQGELVCTRPFVSMPVSFWNDPDGSKYNAAYFEKFPGVWRHGDWCELTAHEGMIIYGRSDATLNPGGVRIGTAEIYRQVEQLPEVVESVAIGQEIGGDTGDVRVVLFVRLQEGKVLDDELRDRIRTTIRMNTSPLHVPKKIVQVSDIPRTISGKISEIAVRDVVHGRPVSNTEALANPDSLKLYVNIPQLSE
jgi:acetoacetyl-CoA synthetase